jgi:prephenate dehydrogenase
MSAIGIIGYGAFGRFMAGHLAKHAEVLVHDRHRAEVPSGVRWAELDEVASASVVILAVPVQEMEALLRRIGKQLKPGTLVLDVASVKTLPVELMKQYVPDTCEIMATHPLFGPQSGAKGIAGFTVVTWPVRVSDERYKQVQGFLATKLQLEVREVDPAEHDREMAYVHALTFYIGRALDDMDIPATPLKTTTYQHMLDIRRLVMTCSPELLETIERHNPYAQEVRERLLAKLEAVESEFGQGAATRYPG